MNTKVKSVLDKLIEHFKTGNIPDAVAYAMYPKADIPCAKWSLFNQLMVALSQTMDCRGYRQWQEVNRFVKKGSKAVYILVPWIKKDKDDEDKLELMGFMSKPVFRYEDTDGEEVEYKKIELPKFPLMERAEEWGIKVEAIPGNESHYGYYSPTLKIIGLATPEEKTFFHELMHCADEKNEKGLKPGQDPGQEIVAEFGALCLCRIVGKTLDKYTGNTFRYIQMYADKIELPPYLAVLKFIKRIENALNLVLYGNSISTPP
jgi:hypothetical protein